ncbi:hypothetical protein C7416_104471 [Cupriavidus phytorum]|uniref:Scaffolding protein n=1 Tax=Cupriavidus phytorum TaxID=3024399 RepID=A0A2W7P2D1_9BURK|nr:hypothetical protein [Cupriavidus alkaliphilus]PZX29466.1 hypothetical protein C7416_104471 [Cupriavidus alkaliphilus]
MSEELQDVTPTEVIPTETGAEVENQAGSEATAEQEAEQQTDQQQEQAQKKEPWFQKRIGELTREKYEAKRAADEARAEAERYRQALAQGQQGERTEPEFDVEALAEKKANQKLAEQRFNDACNKVYATGKSEFQDFDQAVSNLQMVGANRDFLELATTSDAGHKLLHHLGTDLDEAARIMVLPPIQMARELTRLEFKLSQPAVKPVSKAPAPIKPVGTGGATSTGLSDDLPIDEWMRRHNQRK